MSQHALHARASFVGRTRELAALDAALARARGGTGWIVLLVGAPGIGKTRLLDEFSCGAREAGATVLAGRCYEGPGAPACWPWVQILRTYVHTRDAATLAAEIGTGAGDVAAVLPELRVRLPGLVASVATAPEQARFRLFDAVTVALTAASAREPMVVLLDDLHAADPSSLLLLQFMAREIRGAGVVVVGALRDAALAPGHMLADTLAALAHEQVSEWLELGGLAVDEVDALMTELVGERPAAALVTAVHERTEGNPLHVATLTRAMVVDGGLPRTPVENALPAAVATLVCPTGDVPPREVPILEPGGEFWRIAYGGKTVLLRHCRGLVLLAHLVRCSGRHLHVRELDAITPAGGSPLARHAPAAGEDGLPIPGDAGEMLDDRARAEYRRRMIDLQWDLDEAERCHDLGRIGAIRDELELLADQLRTATAAHGRHRRASADIERLRLAITRRIRAAIEQIAKYHPALGAHLDAAVTTGYHCSYCPTHR